MGSFSDYLENKILDHVLGGPDLARPATVYVALLTAAPNDASTGSTIVETAYEGYVRKAVANDLTQWPAAVNGVKANGLDLEFAQCTGGLDSNVTHFAVLDAAVNGNVLGHGTLTVPKVISENDIPRFGAGDLIFTLD